MYNKVPEEEQIKYSLSILSTASELKLATDTPFWKDVTTIINRSIVTARDNLEHMGKEYQREDMAFTQGQLDAFRSMLALPDQILNAIVAIKAEKEEEEKRNERPE